MTVLQKPNLMSWNILFIYSYFDREFKIAVMNELNELKENT